MKLPQDVRNQIYETFVIFRRLLIGHMKVMFKNIFQQNLFIMLCRKLLKRVKIKPIKGLNNNFYLIRFIYRYTSK